MSFLPDVDGRAFGVHHLFFETKIIYVIYIFHISKLIPSNLLHAQCFGDGNSNIICNFSFVSPPKRSIVLWISFKVKNVLYFFHRTTWFTWFVCFIHIEPCVLCTIRCVLFSFFASSSSATIFVRDADIMLMDFHFYCRW